jgi:hypothetical protein
MLLLVAPRNFYQTQSASFPSGYFLLHRFILLYVQHYFYTEIAEVLSVAGDGHITNLTLCGWALFRGSCGSSFGGHGTLNCMHVEIGLL